MKPTYLYVKQHITTGLKYFGKTTRKNPLQYTGSGLYWSKHLKAHGKDVKTLWIKLFENEKDLVDYALQFSINNNIVESSQWANLKNENGLDGGRDGGYTGRQLTDKEKTMHSERMKTNNPMHNKQAKLNHSLVMKSKEHRHNLSLAKKGNTNTKGKSWYNNGVVSKMFFTPPNKEWILGRLYPHWNHKRKKQQEIISD